MTSTARPTAAQVLIAEESYLRVRSEAFFQAFYKRFLASDPVIPEKFSATDFTRQNQLLQHGIGLLLSFARRRNPGLLARIADRHGAHDLDIAPHLYAKFVDSLVDTVREMDASCTPDVEAAWRIALAPGIDHMIEHHER